MKYVGWLFFLAAGAALGWFGRGWSDSNLSERAPSDRTPPRPADEAQRGPAPGTEPYGPNSPASGVARAAPSPSEAPEAPPTEDAEGDAKAPGADMEAVGEMLRAQSPQWKAFAKMQLRQRLGPLLKELGYDAATASQIEEAFVADVDRSIDALIAMMVGDAPVDDSIPNMMMGLPPKLSPQLERDLATLMGDHELARLRDTVKDSHDKQMEEFVDMQIGMMGIADLTDAQRQEVRSLFRENDPMKEQFKQFADVTRDREKFARILSGEGLAEEIEKSMAPRRERMRQILTPQQFEQYRSYEKTMITQAEMGMKMLQAMGKQKPAPPAGSSTSSSSK